MCIFFGFTSFISWKIIGYLYDKIRKLIKKKTTDNQKNVVKAESILQDGSGTVFPRISQGPTESVGILPQLIQSRRNIVFALEREAGIDFYFLSLLLLILKKV